MTTVSSPTTEVRIIAAGLEFPEGPIAMTDGSVLVTEIAAGTLTRVSPDGRIERIAELGGGPNGAAIGPDGAVYVCNNGGSFSFHRQNGLLVFGAIRVAVLTASISQPVRSQPCTEPAESIHCVVPTISCSTRAAAFGSPITVFVGSARVTARACFTPSPMGPASAK